MHKGKIIVFGILFWYPLAGVTYLDRVCISVTAQNIMRELSLTELQMSFVFSAFAVAGAVQGTTPIETGSATQVVQILEGITAVVAVSLLLLAAVVGAAFAAAVMVYGTGEAALEALAPEDGGLAHVGPVGAGHYTKMVHNGVEYGLMQAYAEGFELMSASEFGLDLPRIASLWMKGSVVRSWLLELTADALAADPELASLKAWVEDSGEGRWTVEDAVEKAVPAPVITASLYARFRSRRDNSFADRLLAAMRNAFGGHAVRR